MTKSEVDFIPATVVPPSSFVGMTAALTSGSSDIIRFWPKKAYGARTLSGRVLNQRYFLCNAPDAVRRVMSEKHDNYDRKLPMQRYWLEPLLGDGLFVSDGELWKQRRRQCAPALRRDRMSAYAPIMVKTALEFVDRWHNRASDQPIDVLNEMALLTSRIIGRSIFGDDVSDREAAQVVRGFTRYQQVAESLDFALIAGLPWFRIFRRTARQREVDRAARQVHEVIDRIIDGGIGGLKHSRDTLLTLLQSAGAKLDLEGECPMSSEAVRNEAIVMFMAGHETTANTLAWAWYLLSSCPHVAARMYEEVDAVLSGRTPTLDDVSNLVYTRAVFEEALRLYPPVPVMGRQARDGDEIRGQKISPGTIMIIAPWLLHRHEKCWDAPNAFRPDRFLPGNPRPDNYLYIPFSAGHRVCPGIHFGLIEGVLCLATLAQHFRLRVVPGHVVELDCRMTLRPKGGLPMFVERRTAI